MRAVSLAAALAASLTLALASPGLAAPRQFVGLYGGYTLPTGDFADAVDANWGFQVAVYSFLDGGHRVAGGLELGYLDFEGKDPVDFTVTPVSFQARAYALGPDDALRPYVAAGLGAYYIRAESGLFAKSEYDFAMMAGAGLEWTVHPRVRLAADAQYHWVMRDDLDPTFAVLRAGVVLPIGS